MMAIARRDEFCTFEKGNSVLPVRCCAAHDPFSEVSMVHTGSSGDKDVRL